MTEEPMDPVVKAILLALAACVALALVSAIATLGPPPYTQRIEERYGIDVVSIAGKYGDGTVTYIDGDGRTCAASQAPRDELVFLSCSEVGS